MKQILVHDTESAQQAQSVEHNTYITLIMRQMRHWLSIAGMSPQSHEGDEEDGRNGLPS